MRNRTPINHDTVLSLACLWDMRWARLDLPLSGFWGKGEVKGKFYKARNKCRDHRKAAAKYGSRLP